jgi:hypothetical protein
MISILSHLVIVLLWLWVGLKGLTAYYKEVLFQKYYENWLGGIR